MNELAPWENDRTELTQSIVLIERCANVVQFRNAASDCIVAVQYLTCLGPSRRDHRALVIAETAIRSYLKQSGIWVVMIAMFFVAIPITGEMFSAVVFKALAGGADDSSLLVAFIIEIQGRIAFAIEVSNPL